ncbi:overproduction-induced pheromone-resistant [Diatrype stigma]|uniref:Overproduction-induced pheromone-resistant n=1 Tax=Diatrype stigma TaxID=117547 RepID=A0AAN9YU55_9PEZI
MDCQSCPKAVCVPDASAGQSESESGGPSAGAIAGGVIGGLAAIALVTYLVWRFCIKNKRDSYAPSNWQEDGEHSKEGKEDFASRRSQRASTHTVNSIASTVLTRASNIIQIAYIPGVTNRATPTSPTVLVPPVPPIPLAHADNGHPSPYEDQHFFVPADLRDSTYSGYSGVTDRTSMARSSYAPRSSVASTIYGKNVVISPMPAQKGTLLKPSLVSVKSRAGSDRSEDNIPPVPNVDLQKYEAPVPSPAFSIGTTFFKNATTSTATSVRPQIVRVGNSPKQVDVKGKASPANSEQDENASTLVEVNEASKEEKEGSSSAITVVEDTPNPGQGPFADPPEQPSGHLRNRSLGAITEISGKRDSQMEERQNTATFNRDPSPFSDQNAMKDN